MQKMNESSQDLLKVEEIQQSNIAHAVTETKWTFDNVINALRLIAVPTNIPITGFSIDSREIMQGQVFIALKGKRVDGHDYIEQAFMNGAVMAIVSQPDLQSLNGRSYICVPDTKFALMNLAQYARGRTYATIVGISGSVGKTTVRHWIATLLSIADDTVSTKRNFNGQIGLPLSMTELGENTDFGIFEIGIDAPDTMLPLATLCSPHVAVLTPIAKAHLANFDSIDALASEKALLFSGLSHNGIVVADCKSCKLFPVIQLLAKEYGAIDIVTVGFDEDAMVRIIKSEENLENCITHVVVNIAGVVVEYSIPIFGSHFVLDSAIALASAISASYKGTFASIISEHADEIKNIFIPLMNTLALLEGRGQSFSISLSSGGQVTIIDDAYNANIASMLAGIESLIKHPGKRRIAVIGDMLDLGGESHFLHEQLFSALDCVDCVYAVGEVVRPFFSTLPKQKQCTWAATVAEIEPQLIKDFTDGDVVWIKSSHNVGLNKLVEKLRRLRDDAASCVAA
ncbi:MAG: UDP-N-acetylmuramoyl-tripeptide--D-alanyl-D-alanine ligase [Holosporales bacterium]|jgi:UDP-N-acetylmuramoyl-tripeptide--D-alanyl-D-alanine ligase|nr:UDP-N-acetylmuramoyl-tripeptide--D-alanyl-D-alanine ligase [Holosporales bacterium]